MDLFTQQRAILQETWNTLQPRIVQAFEELVVESKVVNDTDRRNDIAGSVKEKR